MVQDVTHKVAMFAERLLRLVTIPYDKALHCLYGLVVYSFVVLYSPVVAVVLVVLVACGKEWYDHVVNNKHTASVLDIMYTCSIPIVLSLLSIIVS